MSTLARALIESGRLPANEIERCQHRAQQRKTSLPSELSQAELMESGEIARFIEQTLGYPLCDSDSLNQVMPLRGLPAGLYTELYADTRFLPLSHSGRQLVLAMADPTDESLLNLVRFQSSLSIDPQVADCKVLAEQVTRLGRQLAEGLEPAPASADAVSASGIDDAPAVRFLNQTLCDAVDLGASDIHFEPYEQAYRVRYRIDGILQEAATPPPELREMLASRLKVLSRLNIAEKRLPQDGQMRIETDRGDPVDFRISTMPTLYGEKIVLRILDRRNARLSIHQLGLSSAQAALLLQAIHQPSGMILVTGPTGSGKTVTLYACLNELNQTGVNIATVEDPVEIPVAGINQVNIDERTGLNFAVALRAFMRQDPDILMVGEIRDLETADIAVKAAQTGHLVLSTLHTRSAPASLERLRQLGLPAFNVAGSVLLIVAQRLVRKLCACRVEDTTAEDSALHAAGFTPTDLAARQANQWSLFKPQGCPKCHQSGYKGRIALFEIMPVSQALQQIILQGGSALDIAEQARKEGMVDLRRAGLAKVLAGDTSLAEVLAATEDRD
ncbi:MAG: GspE/PulE family protein [Fluviibacter sp.]